ncbi:hypothetical protein HOG21_03570 [bacterium]|jgi:predicted Zn-dependent protease|nr:hypothetical protein [bacterium]
MFEKIDCEKIAEVLEDSVEFATTHLKQDHYLPSNEGKDFVTIIPSSASFSLLGTMGEVLEFNDGGLLYEDNVNASTMRCNLIIGEKIVSGIDMSFQKLSMFSKETLFIDIKRSMLKLLPALSMAYTNMDRINVGRVYLAPKKEVTYIQDKPTFNKVPDEIGEYIENVSGDFYKMKNVFSCSISVINKVDFNIFVDKESKIIQYTPLLAISITIEYLDSNNEIVKNNVNEYYPGIPSIEEIEKLRRRCLDELELDEMYHDLLSGTYPVLLKPSASNVFFHEALAAHLLSATYITYDYSTIFKERIGEKISSLEGIDIIMDPGLKNGFGSYKYDHEGVLAKNVYLVKDGVIKNYLSDRSSQAMLEEIEKDNELVKQLMSVIEDDETLFEKYVEEHHLIRKFRNNKEKIKYLLEKWALDYMIKNVNVDESLHWRGHPERLTQESNGHSRVQSWSLDDDKDSRMIHSEARMSNLVVSHSDKNVKAKNLAKEMKNLCKESKLDFYLEVEALNGYVEPDTGLFVIDPHSIYKVYTDGKREYVKPGTFSLNLEDFLENIVSVGTNNEENRAFCGASSGFVPVGSMTPDMIVWNIPYQTVSTINIATDEEIIFLQHK